MEKRINSDSENVTRGIARELIERYANGASEKPLVLMLYGNLGVGKTVFMKEVGRALGLDDVVSPAFVVYFEYPLLGEGLRYLYHFDLYRVDEASEFDHLGIDDILQPGNIIAIEWSEKASPVESLLREKGTVVEIHLEHAGEDHREITIIEPEL
jgi:tRNA threonylcarbamoyl adenosine modification protein YjeE